MLTVFGKVDLHRSVNRSMEFYDNGKRIVPLNSSMLIIFRSTHLPFQWLTGKLIAERENRVRGFATLVGAFVSTMFGTPNDTGSLTE